MKIKKKHVTMPKENFPLTIYQRDKRVMGHIHFFTVP